METLPRSPREGRTGLAPAAVAAGLMLLVAVATLNARGIPTSPDHSPTPPPRLHIPVGAAARGGGGRATAQSPAASTARQLGRGEGICANVSAQPEQETARCLTVWDAGKGHGMGSIFQSIYSVYVSAARFGLPFCFRADQYELRSQNEIRRGHLGNGSHHQAVDDKNIPMQRRLEYFAGHAWPSNPACTCCVEYGWGCCYNAKRPGATSAIGTKGTQYRDIQVPDEVTIRQQAVPGLLDKDGRGGPVWRAPGEWTEQSIADAAMASDVYTPAVFESFRAGMWLGSGRFTCPFGVGITAMHVRRGDAGTEGRLHKVASFVSIAEAISKIVPKGTVIHVISEGTPDEFEVLTSLPFEVKLILGDEPDAYTLHACLMQSKHLAISNSLFSITAAMFSKAEAIWLGDDISPAAVQAMRATGAKLHIHKAHVLEDDEVQAAGLAKWKAWKRGFAAVTEQPH